VIEFYECDEEKWSVDTYLPVRLDDAIRIVRERVKKVEEAVDPADIPLSDQMFGFTNRREESFIELVVWTEANIEFKLEYEEKRRLIARTWDYVVTYEIESLTADDVCAFVSKYFRVSRAELVEEIETKEHKKSSGYTFHWWQIAIALVLLFVLIRVFSN
jgi:hypothetical protein